MTHLFLQQRLQQEAYGIIFGEMTQVELVEQIKTNVLALTDELHEALAEVGWKPWATSRHINVEALQGELIDAYHFLMNLMLIVNMTDDQVDAMYREKNARNLRRQQDGYDGVAGKCPECFRALDDVELHSKTLASFHPFCSAECAHGYRLRVLGEED